MNISLSMLWGLLMDREAWYAEVHGVTKSRTQLGDWSELKTTISQNQNQPGFVLFANFQFPFPTMAISSCQCDIQEVAFRSTAHKHLWREVYNSTTEEWKLGPCVREGVWFLVILFFFFFWDLWLWIFFWHFFFKFYFIFKLYITVLVLPNIKMNPPQVYMYSPSWTLLPPPSPFHPSLRKKGYHPAMTSSVIPFSSCPHPSQHQGLFQ